MIPLLALIVWGIAIYNALVRDTNRVKAGWSDIDVQLRRRHDLIPKLVDAVRVYADYERATLTAVTQLRRESEHETRPGEIAGIEARLGAGVQRLLAVAESYPDLKANQSFLDLQAEISTVEEAIQYARRFYNGAVRSYNTRLQSFPDSLVARPLKFEQAEYFAAELTAGRGTTTAPQT